MAPSAVTLLSVWPPGLPAAAISPGDYGRRDVVDFVLGELDDAVEGLGQLGEVGRALNAHLQAVGKLFSNLVDRVGDDVLVERVELGVFFGGAGDEGEDEVLGAAGNSKVHGCGQRLRQLAHRLAKSADGLPGGAPGRYVEVEAEQRLAWDADFAADEPVDVGFKMHGTGFDGRRGGQGDGKGDFVFVAEVHEGAEGKARGRGKLHLAGGEAGRQSPLDGGGVAGVAGVDPVHVPVLFKRDDEADGVGASGRDAGREGGQLGGEVQRFNRAGGAVADFRDLCVRGDAQQGKQDE